MSRPALAAQPRETARARAPAPTVRMHGQTSHQVERLLHVHTAKLPSREKENIKTGTQRYSIFAGAACAAGVGGASGPGVARGRAVLAGVARRVRCVWVSRMDGARFSGRVSLAIPPD